jgi:predicted nucleotidyltransferase
MRGGSVNKKASYTLSWIKRKVLPVLKRHSVKKAAIFGSFARGEAKARSDVDILIEYKSKAKSLFDLVDLKSDLEDTLDRKVDVITYNSIYWRIRDQILAEQVVIL